SEDLRYSAGEWLRHRLQDDIMGDSWPKAEVSSAIQIGARGRPAVGEEAPSQAESMSVDATMPALSPDDLPRYRLALDRAIRAWGLLADHVRARLTAAIRRAHGVVLKDGFTGGPDIPRSFSVACDVFRESLHELHEFDESPPDFPWPQWGERALAATG